MKTVYSQLTKISEKHRDLTIALHFFLCHKEHVEECEWYYDSWFDYLSGEYVSEDMLYYISHAKKLLNKCPFIKQMDRNAMVEFVSTFCDTTRLRWEKKENIEDCMEELMRADEQVNEWKNRE